MTHTPGSGGHADSSYDPTGNPLTKRDANLEWIVIVLLIGVVGFAVLWLPSLLR